MLVSIYLVITWTLLTRPSFGESAIPHLCSVASAAEAEDVDLVQEAGMVYHLSQHSIANMNLEIGSLACSPDLCHLRLECASVSSLATIDPNELC